MKKIILIILLGVCPFVHSSAQFLIGPEAGINFARLTGTSISIDSKPGWHVGSFVSIPFSDHLSLMPALLYQLNEYTYSYTTTTIPHNPPDSVFTEIASIDATLGYVDIPVLLNYFTGDTKGLMIQAGLQLSLLVTDHSTVSSDVTVSVNGGTAQPGNPTTVSTVKFSKSDVSFVGGLGYKFSKLLIIYARATTGFLKAQQGSFIKDADRGKNFVFEGGVALSFGAK